MRFLGLALGVLWSMAAPVVLASPANLFEPRFETVGAGVIPRDVVPALVQDKAGYFWIATGDGLVRFDGYTFRPQGLSDPDPAKRNLGWIRALLAGNDGDVWIGTEYCGLAKYDAELDTVRLIGNPDACSATSAPLPTIRALAQDSAGRIYAGSIGGGIEIFDPQNSQVTHVRQAGRSGDLADNRVQALLVDRAQNLWAGTWSGLGVRRHSDPGFTKVALPEGGGEKPVVQALLQASDGRIWVGTRDGALYVVDPSTLAVRELIGSAAGNPPVNSFAEDGNRHIWVGTSGGMDLFDARQLKLLRHVSYDIRKPAGLAGNDVRTLLRDQAGWLWVGGFGLGLQRHNPMNQAFAIRSPDLDAQSPYQKSDIRSILQLDNGSVWAFAHNTGVVIFDQSLRAIDAIAPVSQRTHSTKSGAKKLAPLQISSMLQRRDGSIWLGADSELQIFDSDHRLVRSLQVPIGPIRRLFESRDRVLWIGTNDGLYYLSPGAAQVTRARVPNGDLKGEVHVLAQGADDAVWVGATQGLFRIEPGTQVLKQVVSPPNEGLTSPIVIGLVFDASGTLWVDTSVNGLHRMKGWNGVTASFDPVSQRHGVTGKPFGANLLADRKGRIWTQMGVYDPKSDKLRELTARDGVDLGTGWFFSYTATQDGRLLFGGSKGILVVSPEKHLDAAFAPPLLVTELRVNGESRDYGAGNAELVLSPSDRSFSVEFAALDLVNAPNLRYMHRLKGFEEDWVSTTANARMASYSTLAPGQYTLQVRVANRLGEWSERELSMSIVKKAEWWQTYWFVGLCVAMAIASIAGLIRLRTYRLQLRQRALEALVMDRTVELENLNLELQLQSEALLESSLVDPLTGLNNRRFFAQQIDGDMSMARRAWDAEGASSSAPDWTGDLVFFLIDIDHFKKVNDTYGHAVGDEVLVQMAHRLRAVFRDSDYLMRWGGEEFLGVARQTSRTSANELAERIRLAIAERAFETQAGRALDLTVSIGFAAYPLSLKHTRALGWEDLLKLSDSALYLVKSHGRNGWAGVNECSEMDEDQVRGLAKRPLEDFVQTGGVGLVCSDSVQAMRDKSADSNRH